MTASGQASLSAESALCADCNQLITDCLLRSVVVLPEANREMNHRSSRQIRQRRPAAQGAMAGWAPRSALSGVRVPEHGAFRVARPGVSRVARLSVSRRGTARGTAVRIVPAQPVLSVR